MLWTLLVLAAMFRSTVGKPAVYAADENYQFAAKYIPEYRYDAGAKDIHCWPDEASEKNSGTCKDFSVQAPLYYKITDCEGKYRKLSWWLWYGKQFTCNSLRVQNDWEHITINFIKKAGNWIQDSVTFFQFDGWYTRNDFTNPVVVYVGKVRHGSYDNWCSEEHCHTPCEYWNDFRDDLPNGVHWFPINIKGMSEVPKHLRPKHHNQHFSNPQLNSCFGDNFRCAVGSCGCWRNNHEFQAPFCNN